MNGHPSDPGSSAAPEVSVLIQTYQHAAYVGDAIESVLEQQAPFEFEIVIADDCSTDGTRELLRRHQARHPELIRLLLPERNLGSSQIFRRAVAELGGRYVAWLDGDDFWSDSGKLALQVEALRENPDWAACFHDASVLHDGGGAPDRAYVPGGVAPVLGFADLLRSNCVPALSVMAHGHLVRGLPEWVWKGLWSDWLALLSFAQHGKVGYLPRSMGVYRVHPGGVSSSLSRGEQLEEDFRFFEILREVAGEEHRTQLETVARERHCQLAVERAGVPFDGAVAALGRPDETPNYLNGRRIWPLADEPAELGRLDSRDRDGSLAAQLERLRVAAAEASPAVPHFPGDQAPAVPGEGRLHLLVVGPMTAWLDRYSRLGRQLGPSPAVLWQDEICALYEVSAAPAAPIPMGAMVEITEVSLRQEPEGLFGCHLDLPLAGHLGDAHALEIAGWAIGDGSPVVAIELAHEDKAFRRLPIGVPRPDLELAFPGRPNVLDAGFQSTVSLVGTGADVSVELRAVLKDQRRLPFGSIQGRRRWRETLDGPTPLVSVIVPCYGQAHFLAEAIESVLAQTYAQVEVLAIDDGSPDNAARVAARFPGVRCIRQPNSGLAAARNAGIRESEGELLVFLDADDRLMPRALELGVEELRRHPEAAFAFGRYRRIDVGGAEIEGTDQPRPADPPYSVFLRCNYAGIPATGVFRRSALERVGNFDESLPGAEDYDLGLRISHQLAVRPHAEYVAEYRIHGGGMSRKSSSMLAMTRRALRRQRKHVRGDASLRQAYRAGKRFWRDYYGEPLVAQVRSDFANREWGEGLRGAAALLRHHPRGLLALARRPRAGG